MSAQQMSVTSVLLFLLLNGYGVLCESNVVAVVVTKIRKQEARAVAGTGRLIGR